MALNKNDYLLIEFCSSLPKSMSEISRALDIAVTNVATRLEGLKKEGLIDVSEFEKGKPTLIKSKENNPAITDGKIFLKRLNEMNKFGLPNLETLSKALKEETFDTEEVLKYLQAKKRVGFIVTDQGKKFLKENKK